MKPQATLSAGKSREILVFVLGKEEYGVDILKVQEIRGYGKVTPIPGAPDYLKGVFNLRGTIVPVIDMRVKFGLKEASYDSLTVVIILRIVLLLLDARTGNAIVSAVLNVSQIFVAPFNGILNTDALVSGGSVFDVAAVVALIGWTILEMVILWAVGIFRRQPA